MVCLSSGYKIVIDKSRSYINICVLKALVYLHKSHCCHYELSHRKWFSRAQLSDRTYSYLYICCQGDLLLKTETEQPELET